MNPSTSVCGASDRENRPDRSSLGHSPFMCRRGMFPVKREYVMTTRAAVGAGIEVRLPDRRRARGRGRYLAHPWSSPMWIGWRHCGVPSCPALHFVLPLAGWWTAVPCTGRPSGRERGV